MNTPKTGKSGRATNKTGSIAATQAYLNYATNANTSSLSEDLLTEQNRQIDIASKKLLEFENAAASVLQNPNTSSFEKEIAKQELAKLGYADEIEKEAENASKILGMPKTTAYLVIGFVSIFLIIIFIKLAKK